MSIPDSIVRGWPAEFREPYFAERLKQRIDAELAFLDIADRAGSHGAYLRELVRQRLEREKPNITKAARAAGVSPATPRKWRQRVPGFLAAEMLAQHGHPRPPRRKRQGSYLSGPPEPPFNPWAPA